MIARRPGLERRVLASLEAGRIPVLLGGCGAGRTSLLLQLESRLGQSKSQYLDFAAAATTPERCLQAVTAISRLGSPAAVPSSAKGAFQALVDFFDSAAGSAARPGTFLIDDFLDVRTFENFPGLRHVQRDFVARLAASRTRFALASRFTSRVHRLLRDAPARFEVIHAPRLDSTEVAYLARLFNDGRGLSEDIAGMVAALGQGKPAYVHLVLEAMLGMDPAPDPVATLAALFAPHGRLTARCRESLSMRLSTARGYGALKAILGVLAEIEPLTLTEISHAVHRTPGSTKDYLSWLEDVDLVSARSKRYAFEDPLLRLYARLYGRPVPPSDDDIVREIRAYARATLPVLVATVSAPAAEHAPSDSSGIIEID